jgi:hypothetical protein
MNTYTFTNASSSFTTEALSYDEALSALIWHCGSEEAAALWIYRGE